MTNCSIFLRFRNLSEAHVICHHHFTSTIDFVCAYITSIRECFTKIIDNDRYTVAMHQSSQIRHTSAFGTLEAFFQAMGPRFGLAICHDKKGTSWYNQQMSCWCNIITYYVILSIIINHDHSLVFIVIHYHSLLLVVIHYYWLSSTETINEKALNGNSSKFQTMKLQNPPMWQIQRV